LVGVYDSGVGGLSVWRELTACLPHVPLVYLADQAHVPYGPRSLDNVRALAEQCAHWLVHRGCSIVVVACNTASAAALNHLRAIFPHTAFVGIEPAVKPAAANTRSGVIGVLATQATFQSQRYASLVARYANPAGVRVLAQACPAWVDLVERGAWADEKVALPTIEKHIAPLLAAGADQLALGCTHFPFLSGLIGRVVDGRAATVIDPAPAVARQTLKLWQNMGSANATSSAPREFWTTGQPLRFEQIASVLLGQTVTCGVAAAMV
jgi:glutamate racemase